MMNLLEIIYLCKSEAVLKNRKLIFQAIDNNARETEKYSSLIKFLCSINYDQCEEIISYNNLLICIDTHNEIKVWKFKCIIVNQGTLTSKDKCKKM